jgi:hypothetical protein
MGKRSKTAKRAERPRGGSVLRSLRSEVFDLYVNGGGFEALDLLCDLERVMAGERPLRQPTRDRYQAALRHRYHDWRGVLRAHD